MVICGSDGGVVVFESDGGGSSDGSNGAGLNSRMSQIILLSNKVGEGNLIFLNL